MVTERPFVVIGLRFQLGELQPPRRQLVQPAPHEVWMTADQPKIARHFGVALQGRAVAVIEFRHLIEREIFESESRANIERRLIQIGDEQMRFGRVGDGERQAAPMPRRVERAFVMPRPEQPEDLTAKSAGE